MRFPFFALIAPIVTSVVLWLVTGSAYTLLFAFLGPVMAIGQYVDSKIQTKREEAKKADLSEEHELALSQQQQLETFALREETVKRNPPSSFFARPENSLRPLWAAHAQPAGESRVVRLGIARSGGLPVVLDVTTGLALRGSDVEVRSVMRSVAFQLAWNWGNHEITRVGLDMRTEPEMEALLSAKQSCPTSMRQIEDMDPIPLGFRYLLKVDHGLATLLDTIDGAATPIEMSVDLLTRAESNRIIPTLLREAPREIESAQEFPSEVELVLNTEYEWQSSRHSLVVNVGRQRSHPLLLDLVSAGPHAVVTGMTGSGKTEFLKSWLVALAASYSPDQLSFLVIDFKGGAGFAQLQNLAHVVGVVTDLDHHEALRAMTSLQAEIRYREQVLAQAEAGDITSLADEVKLGRLVVIVDEYKVVLDTFPELMNVFVDLAARGRSLGIHLVLSSQRVGGSLGDALLANCALRVGFRVSQKHDSHALLGNDAAYELPHLPGRAVMMGTGMDQREFHAARLDQQDIEVVEAKTEQWRHDNPAWSVRTTWLPKLATVIHQDEMPQPIEGVSWLGLMDIPEHQLQTWVQYSTPNDGNLLVTGPSRAGISNACHLVAQQRGVAVIADAESAWDAVVEGEVSHQGVLVIDELDAILDEFDLEHREEFVQCLTRMTRHAPKAGKAVVVGCSENVRGLSTLLALFPLSLKLISHSQPGRAHWNGHEVQLVMTDTRQSKICQTQRLTFDTNFSYVVITHHTQGVLGEVSHEVSGRVIPLGAELSVTNTGVNSIWVGTPEEWMSRASLLNSLKSSAVLVLDECSSSELRGLRLRSGLFPHVGYGKTLVVEPDGSTTRVIL